MKSKLITKKRILFSGLLVILVLSAFVSMPVNANGDDEDDDGVDDEIEEENSRDVVVEYAPYEVTITSSIHNNGIENEFEVQAKVGSDGLILQLEFEEDNDSIETEIEFEVAFTEIMEFRDTSGDGIFNESEEIIQTLELDDFKAIQYNVESIDNETVHVLFVETIDENFTATLYITGEFANISQTIVAPTEVKIDIGIHSFDFDEIDTQLALKVELDSEREVDYEEDEETEDEENGYAEDEHEIEVNLDEYSTFFSWKELVMVDGIEQEVKFSPLKRDSGDNFMYLNYPRGDEIIHDPKIGISGILDIPIPTQFTGITSRIILPNLSRNELLIVTAATLAVMFSLVMVFRGRKRE
ncbi:MAG: hypothetical protein ACXAAM_02595 [Candidatus Heimdallarchaeaceae archaeon]